jgi:hypothetical protein
MLLGICRAKIFENARDHLFVNSWCLGEHESMATWQIYGSHAHGVALKSSIDRYKSALQYKSGREHYQFGPVKYHEDLQLSSEVKRDFTKGPFLTSDSLLAREVLELGFHKRSCFDHEKEWRAAIFQDESPQKGILVKFDLDKLIKEVVVGPRAEEFLVNTVNSVLKKYGLDKPVYKSKLLDTPIDTP